MNSDEKENAIINVLRSCGEMGARRQLIVKKLKIPRTTVYDALKRMEGYGWVEKYTKKFDTYKGRPYTFWKVKAAR